MRSRAEVGNLRDDTPASERWRSLLLKPGLTEKMTERQMPRNRLQCPSQVNRSPDGGLGHRDVLGAVEGAMGAMGDEPRAPRRTNHRPADRRSMLGTAQPS